MENRIAKQLDPIFKARSVAFIGASSTPGKWGYRVIENAIRSGYRGNIYPINPGGGDLFGIKVYKDVNDVPGDIDLAVFTVLAERVPAAMTSCVKKGIKGAVVISADFAETGKKGKALEAETVRIAKGGGLRFIGPNGMGLFTAAAKLNIALDDEPLHGHLAFISQSGTYGGNLARAAKTKGYGLRTFISLGNQADITVSELLEYLLHDPETRVVVLYLEGVRQGREFFEAARRITRVKPVLVYKGGRSEEGSRATMSHTASIAGSDHIFDAMCRQAGLIRVNEIEHLFIMAEAMLEQPPANGNRVGIVGSGGQGVVAVDSCAGYGLRIPRLADADGMRIKSILPPHAPVPKNPVDFAGGSRSALEEARVVQELIQLPYIDGVICNLPVNAFLSASFGEQTRIAVEGAELLAGLPKTYGKPIVTMKFRGLDNSVIDIIAQSGGIPIYTTPEDCARAFYGLVKYGEILKRQV
ncbi:MAG: CoA-binding protein [Desulfobacterales bacterium]